MRMIPSSSGCRIASSTDGANSPNSSRKRTPRLARLTSPGRSTPLPPPVSETGEAVWWGARNGGARAVGPLGSGSPTAERMRATSRASSVASGGSRPGRRLASMVFPAPGGPTMSRWWAPAAATSSAWRAMTWPRTSARSGAGGSPLPDDTSAAGGRSGHGSSPRSASTTSTRRWAHRTSWRPNTVASATDAAGTTTVFVLAASTRLTMPRTGRRAPSRPSSPKKARSSSWSPGTWSDAASTPMATARSRPDPALRSDDGARFTVIFRPGKVNPALVTAARTRSRASRQAVSGRPTMLKPGRPVLMWTSTRTAWPSMPRRHAEEMDASTVDPPRERATGGGPSRRPPSDGPTLGRGCDSDPGWSVAADGQPAAGGPTGRAPRARTRRRPRSPPRRACRPRRAWSCGRR